MSMQIGIVGKPNVGKSTFFNAATDAHAEIANYPFTTIDANRGVMYVGKPCPCKHFNVKCTPHNSKCIDGTRFVPIEAIDVAGLVPDAFKGRGLGNKFLDDLRQADALIHIVDASGCTDKEGNPCKNKEYDPMNDVIFLEREITYWLNGIIKKNWDNISRKCRLENKKIDKMLCEQLTGLGITEERINKVIRLLNLDIDKHSEWADGDLLNFSNELRKLSKPMLIAFNKIDKAQENVISKIDQIKKRGYIVIPASAESELALANAKKNNLIKYRSGDDNFSLLDESKLTEKQKSALDFIKKNVLEQYGSTGIQKSIEEAVRMLNLIVVYPVEDETHLTDKEGRVLPDAYFMKKGSTAKDLAYKVHTDLGDHFIRAVDAKTHRTIGADHELQDGDVIKILSDK